jgi:hypothetical protein
VELVAVRTVRAESNHVIRADLNLVGVVVDELTLHPVELAEPALIVRAMLLHPLNASLTSSCRRPEYGVPPDVLECALVSLVACAVLLKEAARRDLVRVIDVQEFAVITLLALIGQPMHAHGPLPLALIDPLILRFQYRIQLVPTPDLNGCLGIGIHVGHGHVPVGWWPCHAPRVHLEHSHLKVGAIVVHRHY